MQWGWASCQRSTWRYCSRSIPALSFDNKFVEGSTDNNKSWIVSLPILSYEFRGYIRVRYRSWRCLLNWKWLLRSTRSFLIFQGEYAEALQPKEPIGQPLQATLFVFFTARIRTLVSKCVIKPPSKFNVFSTLRWLYLSNIKIFSHYLKRVLTNCMLLKEFYLVRSII